MRSTSVPHVGTQSTSAGTAVPHVSTQSVPCQYSVYVPHMSTQSTPFEHSEYPMGVLRVPQAAPSARSTRSSASSGARSCGACDVYVCIYMHTFVHEYLYTQIRIHGSYYAYTGMQISIYTPRDRSAHAASRSSVHARAAQCGAATLAHAHTHMDACVCKHYIHMRMPVSRILHLRVSVLVGLR